jgi:hypothetical protein
VFACLVTVVLKFIVQAAVLLVITSIPATLAIASMKTEVRRWLAGAAYLLFIFWAASSELSGPADDPAACYDRQGRYQC